MQKSGFVQGKCAKCGGSLYLDKDQFGWFEQCLQCGFVSNLDKMMEPVVPLDIKSTEMGEEGILTLALSEVGETKPKARKAKSSAVLVSKKKEEGKE